MAPVMTTLMMGRDMRAMWPGEPLFWFVMSLGVTAGFFLAYPINVWLVAHGMKHGLMTVRAGEHKDASAHAHAGHDTHAMANMPQAPGVTRTQLAALTTCSLLALVVGMFVPAIGTNLTLSAHQVGRAIMPPG
jgi:hypothetical protein